MKSRQTKQADLDALREAFGRTDTAFLVEFRGLNVVAVDDLRKQVREAAGEYRVVKNTLARKASEGTAFAAVASHFVGPTAVVSAPPQEPARLAKALSEFAKKNPAVQVKAGLVGGEAVDAAGCQELASLGTREEIVAKLLFLLQSPMRRLATVLSAPSRNLAVVLQQVAEKKSE